MNSEELYSGMIEDSELSFLAVILKAKDRTLS